MFARFASVLRIARPAMAALTMPRLPLPIASAPTMIASAPSPLAPLQISSFAHLRKMRNKMNKNQKKYKLKTHSGAKKRFRFTASGLVKRAHAGKSHLMYHKSPSRKRRLSQTGYVHKTLNSHLRRLMPYQ